MGAPENEQCCSTRHEAPTGEQPPKENIVNSALRFLVEMIVTAWYSGAWILMVGAILVFWVGK